MLTVKQIYNQDQADWKNKTIFENGALIRKRDLARKNAVLRLIQNCKLISSADFYMAAMVFHHGSNIKDSNTAVKLAQTSYRMGYNKALSFYAT